MSISHINQCLRSGIIQLLRILRSIDQKGMASVSLYMGSLNFFFFFLSMFCHWPNILMFNFVIRCQSYLFLCDNEKFSNVVVSYRVFVMQTKFNSLSILGIYRMSDELIIRVYDIQMITKQTTRGAGYFNIRFTH